MIKLFNDDCLTVLEAGKENSIDLVVCDLPYGTTQCKWDTVIDLDKMWKELHRVTKSNAAFVMFAAQPFTSQLIMSNINNFKYQWVWEKSKATNFMNAKHQPLRAHEDICVFYRKPCTYNPQMVEGEPYDKGFGYRPTEVYSDQQAIHVKNETGLRYPRSVQYFKTAEFEGKYHPTQKPLPLLEYLIKTYSNEGDVVLDHTMGSGSTGVAAISLNRKFVGIELERKYYDIANERINSAMDIRTGLSTDAEEHAHSSNKRNSSKRSKRSSDATPIEEYLAKTG